MFYLDNYKWLYRAAGPYEDTRTGPNQVLRPNKVPRTGPNQVLDINCWNFFKRAESQGMNRSLEKNYLMSNEKVLWSVLLYDIIFSVCSGRGVKIWLVLTMFCNVPAALPMPYLFALILKNSIVIYLMCALLAQTNPIYVVLY